MVYRFHDYITLPQLQRMRAVGQGQALQYCPHDDDVEQVVLSPLKMLGE